MTNFSDAAKQKMRLKWHLMVLFASAVYTVLSIYLYYEEYLNFDVSVFYALLILYWLGNLSVSVIIYTHLNLKMPDPSMTVIQMLWGISFMLVAVFIFNNMRGVMLMSFFVMLSFGLFRLTPKQFVSMSAYAIFGYVGIIFYIYTEDRTRIDIELEVVQLVGFTLTTIIMVYTGTFVSQLRETNKIKNQKLEEALILNTRLATTDDLTGLMSRRRFMEVLNRQKSMAERENEDFVILFSDLDHFKSINDNYGHHIGDEVLKIFSDILQRTVRDIDHVSRFGGEEFVIMLVSTDIQMSKKVAERIRQSIEEYNFNDIAPGLKVTVSIGIANYREHSSIQQTLMIADNRMYAAKEQGRNCVVAD